MSVVYIPLLILLSLLLFERIYMRILSHSIPIRILVNGTRGKTTTVSLLVAALNEAGIVTVGRSTGSEARFLLPDGSTRKIDRSRGVNWIRETRWLFGHARRFHARAVVGECSAITPEAQKALRRVMEPTIDIVTNCFVDHVDKMGDDRESTAAALTSGVDRFYTSDPFFTSNSHAVMVEKCALPLTLPSWVHPDCFSLALSVTRFLGISDSVAIRGMEKVRGDVGTTDEIHAFGKVWVNAFSRNDVTSAKELLSEREMGNTTIVYANRRDREFRLPLFAKCLCDAGVGSLYVIGDHPFLCKRIFHSYGIDARHLSFGEIVQKSRQRVVLMGNIKGSGEKLLSFLKEQG